MSKNRERIENGDRVLIRYEDPRKNIKGFVLHIPQDVGDSWVLKVDGQVTYVNPACSTLISVVLLNKEGEG